jgi:hypothetical protein
MITLTETDARTVLLALDLATKAGGLNVAAKVLPVAESIQNQIKKKQAAAIPAAAQAPVKPAAKKPARRSKAHSPSEI